MGSGRCKSFLKHNAFVLILVTSVLIGIGMGIGLRFKKPPWTKREIVYLRFPGEIFLRMLKMVIIPLVVTSIIAAVSALDVKSSGKIGGRTVAYYLSTTFISVIIGIILVMSIRPGSHGNKIDRSGKGKVISGIDSILDLVRNAFPDNVIAATFQTAATELVKPENASGNVTTPQSQWPVKLTKSNQSNVLGLIVFSLAFGVAISKLGDKGRLVRQMIEEFNSAILTVVRGIIWLTPIGIIFLISSKVAEMTDIVRTLAQLALFIATVAAGLAIHMFIILPILYFIIVRKNPFSYLLGMTQALLTALSTSSSSATLPVTLHCATENNKIHKRIAQFVLPLGATINMDGTALYEAVAVIFLAQVRQMGLNFGQIIIVSLTSTAAAIGAAGVPEAGLVTMMIVLQAVGLPFDDVELILAIDWFLDRLRTSTNVWGDAIGAGIIEKLSRDELRKIDYAESQGGHENPIPVNDDPMPLNDIDYAGSKNRYPPDQDFQTAM